MSDLLRSSPALSRARPLIVVWLVSAVLSVVLLPLAGVAREWSHLLKIAGLLGIAVFFCALMLVMWSAVKPWASAATHHRTQATFVAAAVASVPLVAPVAAGEWAT